jgi:hypothetical protein
MNKKYVELLMLVLAVVIVFINITLFNPNDNSKIALDVRTIVYVIGSTTACFLLIIYGVYLMGYTKN